MSRVIGGIVMGSHAIVRPGSDRHREMYGGAVTIKVTVDGVCLDLEIDAADAVALAREITVAAKASRDEYEVARWRRNQPSAGEPR